VSQVGEDGLTLDAVVKRFADSERALSEVRDRLQTLASAATSADVSAASLRETAEAVRGFAENASAAAGELRDVATQARAVLDGGAAMLDGSALRAVEQRLEEVARMVQESQSANASALDELRESVARIDKGAATIFANTLPRRQKSLEYPGE
jgi:ABC-type transporter Mla subunit MlaD